MRMVSLVPSDLSTTSTIASLGFSFLSFLVILLKLLQAGDLHVVQLRGQIVARQLGVGGGALRFDHCDHHAFRSAGCLRLYVSSKTISRHGEAQIIGVKALGEIRRGGAAPRA